MSAPALLGEVMESTETKLVKLKGGLRHLAYDYSPGSLGRLP